MKKFAALFFAVLCCLSMLACTAPSDDTTETTAPAGPVDTYPYPQIKEKLTWDAINAFPVKSSDMTEQELRQLCVDFFRFSKTALWISNSDWNYTKATSGSTDEILKGMIYGGLPYISNSGGNIYRLMDVMDPETGVVDMQWAMENPTLFGNQCANGAGWGWARVINSVKYGSTFTMVISNGFLPVGSYTYRENLDRFHEDIYRTSDVIAENGAEVMFESYAAMKMADGLVNYTEAGHVMMACTDPVVVYTADGSIDPSASYVYINDQHSAWVEGTNEAGDTFLYKNFVEKKFTFAELLMESYIPFTFAEFLGTDPVEETECQVNHTGETITPMQLNAAEVTSNYWISDIYAVVRDEKGNEVHRLIKNAPKVGITALNFNRMVTSEQWAQYTDGKHSLEIICQLGTGERLTVYTGTLVK